MYRHVQSLDSVSEEPVTFIFRVEESFLSWKWRYQVFLKSWCVFSQLYGIASQKVVRFSALITWNVITEKCHRKHHFMSNIWLHVSKYAFVVWGVIFRFLHSTSAWPTDVKVDVIRISVFFHNTSILVSWQRCFQEYVIHNRRHCYVHAERVLVYRARGPWLLKNVHTSVDIVVRHTAGGP